MVPLSVVIITFNEEKNIERCINSVIAIADDIVVVDSFSTDRTEEICLQKGVRFIKHTFEGHIEQKNWAISQAQFPHVLSVDADEALSEELKKSIAKIKENWQYDGYYMNRLTNYCGKWIKHCGWYPDRKLRLWDSRKGMWQGVNPHDKYELREGYKTGSLHGDLLHYSYYSVNDHLKQIQYFTDISAKALFKKGKKSSIFRLLLNPGFKFYRDYLFKLGFLDGYYGFVICLLSSYATLLKYIKLRELERHSSQ